MQNDQKPRIRIIAERVSVTTIRTRSKVICEICRRSLDADETRLALASKANDVPEAAAVASVTENEKEK